MRRYLATVFLQLLVATAAAQQSSGTSIHGHVDAEDKGEPARDAKVTLTEISVFNTRRRAGVSTTDKDGAFTFAGLTPGRYTIYVEQPKFLAGYVADAAPDEDIVIHLRRAAVVDGHVTGLNGEIIGKALVEVMKKNYTYGDVSLQSVGLAWTDGRGIYQVSGLAPGRYYVRASLDGYDTILYPAATRLAGARSIDLKAGSEKDGLDFRLRRGPRFALEGRLLDSANRGPAQAKFLRAYSADPVAGTFVDGVVHDGQFRLDGLKPGRYFLNFSWVGPTNNVTRSAAFPFEMGSVDESGVVLRAARESVAGRVDTGGRRLAGQLSVYLEPTETAVRAHIGGDASANVAPDGTFRMPGVEIGEYHVRVHYSEAASFFVNEQSLIVDGRAPITGIELKLDFSAGSVFGKAIDAAGKPMPGATVVLQSTEPERSTDNLYLHVYGAGATGTYSIPGVVPGEYLLFSWQGDPGLVSDPDLSTLARNNARRIRVNRGDKVSQDAIELLDPQNSETR